jgi:hypothetical protein
MRYHAAFAELCNPSASPNDTAIICRLDEFPNFNTPASRPMAQLALAMHLSSNGGTTMLRSLLRTFVAMGLLCVGVVHSQERPNFAGKWVADGSTLNIIDTPGLVTVERIEGGETERLSFSFVGQSEPLIVGTSGKDGVGGPTIVQEAKASWHDGHLDTFIARQINGKTVTQNIRYTLDPNGSRMTVERNLQVHHGYEAIEASSGATKVDVYTKSAP